MADKFNLTGFLKKNQLLNENIGGYVDIKPMREEMGTAMGEDEQGLGTTDDRIMALGGDRLLAIVRELTKEGFYLDDIVRFLVSHKID